MATTPDDPEPLPSPAQRLARSLPQAVQERPGAALAALLALGVAATAPTPLDAAGAVLIGLVLLELGRRR
jgi:hypothetical protein